MSQCTVRVCHGELKDYILTYYTIRLAISSLHEYSIQNCVLVYSRLHWSQFHLREFLCFFPFPSQPFHAFAGLIVNSVQVAVVTAFKPPGACEHCRTVVVWVWVVVLVFRSELPPNFVIHCIAFRPHITKQRTVSHQSAKSPIGEYKNPSYRRQPSAKATECPNFLYPDSIQGPHHSSDPVEMSKLHCKKDWSDQLLREFRRYI